jgi:uncharacterized protein involved in response to NO
MSDRERLAGTVDEERIIARSPHGPHWRVLWTRGDPHRFAFTGGALVLAVGAAWWACELVAVQLGRAAAGSLTPALTHGVVMTFGFMPLFFSGFLAGTASRWLGRPALPARGLVVPLSLQLAGWLAFVAASSRDAGPGSKTAALAALVAAIGWTGCWLQFAGAVRASHAPDRAHARLIVAAGGIGALAMLGASAAVAAGDLRLVRACIGIGLWLFVGFTFAAAAHRMVPFLGAALPALDTRRPRWLLGVLVALFLVEGASSAAESLGSPLPALARWMRSALEGGAAVTLLALVARWRAVQNPRIRLLAMLRTALAWLATAFALLAASHVGPGLGAAPIHAYAMGFLGSMMMTMVTRFVCGQTGRAVVAGDFLWRLFWMLQAAVAARVAGALMAALGMAGAQTTVAAAACLWAGAWMLWAWRYLPWLASPRLQPSRRAR